MRYERALGNNRFPLIRYTPGITGLWAGPIAIIYLRVSKPVTRTLSICHRMSNYNSNYNYIYILDVIGLAFVFGFRRKFG